MPMKSLPLLRRYLSWMAASEILAAHGVRMFVICITLGGSSEISNP